MKFTLNGSSLRDGSVKSKAIGYNFKGMNSLSVLVLEKEEYITLKSTSHLTILTTSTGPTLCSYMS